MVFSRPGPLPGGQEAAGLGFWIRPPTESIHFLITRCIISALFCPRYLPPHAEPPAARFPEFGSCRAGAGAGAAAPAPVLPSLPAPTSIVFSCFAVRSHRYPRLPCPFVLWADRRAPSSPTIPGRHGRRWSLNALPNWLLYFNSHSVGLNPIHI